MKRSGLRSLLWTFPITVVAYFIFQAGVVVAAPPPSEYYVSPSGSDGNPGTSTQPWRTIQRAANTVGAGDTVYVLPGTYSETFQAANLAGVVTATNGTATSPIRFICTVQWSCLVRTDATATPACVFPGYKSTCSVWYNPAQYVTIQNFDISGTNTAIGIASSGSYSQVIGNRIHDLPAPCNNMGAAGVVTSDTDTNQSVDVIGNLIFKIGANTTANITSISRNNTTGLVTVTTATSHRIEGFTYEVTIAGTSPGSTGLDFNGKFVVIDVDVPLTGTTFYYQQSPGFGGAGSGGTSTNYGCGYHTGIYAQIPGSKIQNNIIHNGIGSGIGGSHRLASAIISNNLLFQNQLGGIEIGGQASPLSLLANMTVTNNIILNNGNAGIWEHDLLSDIPSPYYIGSGNVYRNNLVWNNSSLYRGIRGIVVCNGPLTNCGSLYSTVSGTVSADPLFVNYQDDGTGDYHLAVGSPCIGSGVVEGAPPFDFDGLPRPQYGTYSRGPYERRP